MNKYLTPLLLIIAVACHGCAAGPLAVIVPMVQYGSAAHSGYNFVREYAPRDEIITSQSQDIATEDRILSRFRESRILHYKDIRPHCYNGHVYLLGAFNSDDQFEEATRLAANSPGVRSVTRCLYDEREGPVFPKAENETMRDDILAKIVVDESIRSKRVRVNVIHHNAILLGFVESPQDRDRIMEYAKAIPGMISVTSYLTVEERPQLVMEDETEG